MMVDVGFYQKQIIFLQVINGPANDKICISVVEKQKLVIIVDMRRIKIVGLGVWTVSQFQCGRSTSQSGY